MHGQKGLAAGMCAAVDGDMNEYFLDLTHCRAASQRASRIDRQLLVPTQRRENAQGQQRLRLTIKRRPLHARPHANSVTRCWNVIMNSSDPARFASTNSSPSTSRRMLNPLSKSSPAVTAGTIPAATG